MKVLADENVDSMIVRYLRDRGHDVTWLVESDRGSSDSEIMDLAQREGRVVLTFDRDFGELVYHLKKAAPGVILLRFEPQIPAEMLAAFVQAWPQLESSAHGHFIVVKNQKVRIRPLVVEDS